MSKRISVKDRDYKLDLFNVMGEESFVQKIVDLSLIKAIDDNYQNPELDILDKADGFVELYRKTSKKEYLDVARALRKAAHLVYRKLLKEVKHKQKNLHRFLNLVQ